MIVIAGTTHQYPSYPIVCAHMPDFSLCALCGLLRFIAYHLLEFTFYLLILFGF